MPVPILCTPFVVLSEIISLLETEEIVAASFCSKKMKRFLKCYYQQRKPLEWNIYLKDYDSCGRVHIHKLDDEYHDAVLLAEHVSELDESEAKPIETNGYKRGFSSGLVSLYFEDRVMGTKMIVDYVTDLFNLDVYGLIIDTNGIWAIDWISRRQEKMLESFELVKNPKCNSSSDEALNYVLRNVRASEYCTLEDMFPVNFRFDGKLGPVNRLLIDSYGHWVTLDNLMNFEFTEIIVKRSRISASDLHSFLTHWCAGGLHRMTFISLEFETDRNFENLKGALKMIETDDMVEDLLGDGDEWNGDYSIQRIDGVKAVIDLDIRHFVMTVLPPKEII
ncbi:unnamed protein product [Caenorhabditis nigoni]